MRLCVEGCLCVCGGMFVCGGEERRGEEGCLYVLREEESVCGGRREGEERNMCTVRV